MMKSIITAILALVFTASGVLAAGENTPVPSSTYIVIADAAAVTVTGVFAKFKDYLKRHLNAAAAPVTATVKEKDETTATVTTTAKTAGTAMGKVYEERAEKQTVKTQKKPVTIPVGAAAQKAK